MGVVTGLLFWDGGELRDYLAMQKAALAEEVGQAPEEHVLQAVEDAWVEGLVERYRVECPVLHSDQMYQDEAIPMEIDVSGDPRRDIRNRSAPFHVAGHRVVVRIPFDGEGQIFELKASRFTLNPPRGNVRGQEILDIVDYEDGSPVDIRSRAERLAADLEQYLGYAKHDIDIFQRELENHARLTVQNRRAAVKRHRDHLAATGLPTRRSDATAEEPATYIADIVVRRPAPPLPAMSLRTPMKLEPAISNDAYEDILSTIRSAARGMERSPTTYAGMDEEDIRQVVLLPLNDRFKGQAMAEAFNTAGKTDILIRWEDANLFIAEFKIWRGVKSFTSAIDQLFGYRAWRDTKLALVIVVHERDLTAVLEKSSAAVKAHEQFVDWQEFADETELRATMGWPGDERRIASLAVAFLHLPN